MVVDHANRHPREYVDCTCGGEAPHVWQQERTLPQVGQTYSCTACGREVYVYDAGDPGETLRQWRDVTQGMLVNLQFFGEVGEWPDSATEDLLLAGVERMPAIDYHVVEREGLTQTEWADRTDRDQSTVAQNIDRARGVLADQ